MPKFHTVYDRPIVVGSSNEEPSRTLQQFKDEADVNYLIQRYMKTGMFYNPLTQTARKRIPDFGDYSSIGTFAEQQQHLISVYEEFSLMPAKVRERFSNNPALFVEFAGDPKNIKECMKMGIFVDTSVPAKTELPPPVEEVKVGDGTAVANPVSE